MRVKADWIDLRAIRDAAGTAESSHDAISVLLISVVSLGWGEVS